MVVKKLFLIFVIIVLGINLALALSPLGISSDKYSYSIGDKVMITAEVYNLKNVPAEAVLEYSYKIEGGSANAVVPVKFNLGASESRRMSLFNLTVDRNLYPGIYVVTVSLILDKDRITRETSKFEIINTPKLFNMRIKICKDLSCLKESNTFIIGEAVFVDYSSNISDLDIETKLTYPNKSYDKIIFPFNFKASDVGLYELEISAKKEGYKSINKIEQFAVIDKNAVIIDSPSNPLPSDTVKKNLPWLAIVLILMIIIIIFLIINYFKNKEDNEGGTKPKVIPIDMSNFKN